MSNKFWAGIFAAALMLGTFSAQAALNQLNTPVAAPQVVSTKTAHLKKKRRHRHCHIVITLGHANKKCHTHSHWVLHHG